MKRSPHCYLGLVKPTKDDSVKQVSRLHRTNGGCAEIMLLDVYNADRTKLPLNGAIAAAYGNPGNGPWGASPQKPCGGELDTMREVSKWGCKQVLKAQGIGVPNVPKRSTALTPVAVAPVNAVVVNLC